MMLADLGADVTKVERPGSGDDTRTWGPPFDDAGRATYFQAVNRNKRSVALDLADPAGRERAAELVARRRRRRRELPPRDDGAARARLRAARATNPGLVYCSITGFGSGAGAELPGYDLLVQALGGLMSITGEPDGEPQKVGVALVDVLAGLFATRRHPRRAAPPRPHRRGPARGGRPALLAARGARQPGERPHAHRRRSRPGWATPTRASRRTSSSRPPTGELVLAVGNDAQFARLCDDARASRSSRPTSALRTNPAGSPRGSSCAELLERRLATAPAAEWVEELTAAGVPAGVVNDVGAAFALAERLGLEPVVEIAREGGGVARLPRNPIRLSATPRLPQPPPDLPPSPSLPESTP